MTVPQQADIFDLIFKAYDIRGLVGTELTGDTVEAIGAAFVDELGITGTLAVGGDMRESSEEFALRFAAGAQLRGADVLHIGLVSTDLSYFVSGRLNIPAAMFTASHNPSAYNGIKLSRPGARGISFDTGLAAIRDRARAYAAQGIPAAETPGTFREQNFLADYVACLRELVPLDGARHLNIAVDAANGMSGLTVPAVFGGTDGLEPLNITVLPLFFELDGTFPNHEANPLDSKNLVDLQRAVRDSGADLGLAFDGDADRVFVVDEKGDPVAPSAVAALVSAREIRRAKDRGEQEIHVIHNLITSSAVPEIIAEHGGIPVRTRVGHSLIKAEMARTGAVFGAEHSAHYYFRDFWGADNGMLAALHLIAEFSAQELPLSEFMKQYSRYPASGEINSRVSDIPAVLAAIRADFAGADFDELDGLTVSAESSQGDFWWFNVRASNTEPLLRLNAEAATAEQLREITQRVLDLIESAG